MITIKVVVVGPGAVGKTVACGVYVGEGFKRKTLATLGADFKIKNTTIGDESLKVQLWYLAGQETFGVFRRTFYLGLGALVVMVDLTRPDTVNQARKYLHEEIAPSVENQDYGCVAVVGSKTDLSNEIQVSENDLEELRSLAEELLGHRVLSFTTSATKPATIDNMFNSVIECSLTHMEVI